MNDPAHTDPASGRSSHSIPRPTRSGRRPRLSHYLGGLVAALALLIATAVPAAAAEIMRVTFIRHAQSVANANDYADTSTPGPIITDLGSQQAAAIAKALGDNNYDAIYASTMVRTQLTAAPMSQYLGLPIQVLPGLQEIEAGIYEGTKESEAVNGYAKIPIAWAFTGNLDVAMPGTNPVLDGHVFDARVKGALQTMYDAGDRNVAVFSHGGTIMFWTMMNAVVNGVNLTVQEKGSLLSAASLSNTNYVVIEGNNEDGWSLVEWHGKDGLTRTFGTQPTFWNNVKLQRRTLDRQLAEAWQPVKDAFQTHDWSSLASAFNHAIADATFARAKYHRAVNVLIQDKLKEIFTPVPAPAPANAVGDTPANNNAAPQAIAPAADPAPVAKVSTLAADTTGDAKVDTGSAKVDEVTPVKAAADPEPAAKDADDTADNDKPARTERPSHKVRDTAKSDDQGSTSTPKHSDTVKKSKKSKTSTSSDAGSSDNGSQSDAA